jgi:hypothetical protein
MNESEGLQLIELTEKRIGELEGALSECRSVSEKKQNQAGGPSANLVLTISAHLDGGILSEHKLELAQLRKYLQWLHTDDACDATTTKTRIRTNRK